MRRKAKAFGTVAVLCSAVTLGGCDNPAIDNALTSYNTDVQKISTAIQKFYSSINTLERTEYFNQVSYSPSTKMSTVVVFDHATTLKDPKTGATMKMVDENGKLTDLTLARVNNLGVPTGLFDKYSNDQILARLKCLQALADYTANLALLASNDSSVKVGQELAQLKTPLNDIGADMKTLSKRNSSVAAVAADIQKFSGPIATLASLAGSAWVDYEKQHKLKLALKDANDKVGEICDLLAADIDEVFEEYDGQVMASVSIGVVEYDKQVKPGATDLTTHQKAIGPTIKASAETLSLVQRSNPSDLIRLLKKIHLDIVDCLDDSGWSNISAPIPISRVFGLNRTVVPTDPHSKGLTKEDKVNIALADLEELNSECDSIINAINKLTGSDSTKQATTDSKQSTNSDKK